MYKWERDGDGTIGHVLDEFMRRISQASELIENAENMVVNTDSPKINDLRVKLGTIRDVCEDINRLEQQIEEARSRVSVGLSKLEHHLPIPEELLP